MRRGVMIGIAAGAVIVAVGAGAAWWLLTRAAGPDETAQSYLQALADGDGTAALDLLDELPRGADADAVAAALGDADSLISSPSVSEVTRSGDSALARVTFALQGDTVAADVALVRADGGWRVGAAGLGSLTATPMLGDTVQIGGQAFAADAPIALLPASYRVGAAPQAVLTGDATVAVLPGADTVAEVPASLRPAATALAQERLDAYAQACAAPAEQVPAHCGIRIPWAADFESLTRIDFRIEQSPTVVISGDAASFVAADGALVATVSGTTRDGAETAVTYRTTTWTLRGDVSYAGGEMTLSVR